MRVLMVEDNKDTLATMAAVLRYERYDLVTAMDGPSALEIAKVFLPEVVLLDIGLPGLDGYRVARALRAQDPRRKLFIAAITGYGTAADKQHAAEADAAMRSHYGRAQGLINQLAQLLAIGRAR